MPHETVTLRTCDLIGAALRYAVAVACGWKLQRIEDGDWKEGEPHWWEVINEKAVVPGKRHGLVGYIKPGAKGVTSGYDYCPDVDWSQGGPLIEARRVDISFFDESDPAWGVVDHEPWVAQCGQGGELGPTALIAACRAIVSAHLGDSVDVPAELAGGGHEQVG